MRQQGYQTRQKQMDREYKGAYDKFLKELSPIERRRLEESGCGAPDTSRIVDKQSDFADYKLQTSPSAAPVDPKEIEGEGMVSKTELLETLRMLLSNVFYPSSGRTREYELDVMGVAIGMLGLVSIAAVARRHGVGRAAVSKAAIAFCNDRNLPPSIYMKSEANREKHRMTNKRGRKRA